MRNSLVDQLGELEHLTRGAYVWSETSGLKQLIRQRTLTARDALSLVVEDYLETGYRENAS